MLICNKATVNSDTVNRSFSCSASCYYITKLHGIPLLMEMVGR